MYLVSINTGANNIVVTWTTDNPILQQQLRSVRVMVTSECPTGIVSPQSQVFSLTADERNSVNARGLGNI